MIGDLTGEPQPVVVKLFSGDAKLLEQTAPRVAEAIDKAGKEHIVDIKNGIEDTISGPATQFNVNPSVAAKAGFTAEEVSTNAEALLQGVQAATPLVANNRAYTIRVRFPDQSRSSFQAMNNTLLTSSSGRTATLGSLAEIAELPGQTEIRRENLQRKVEVTARLEGMSLSQGIKIVQEAVTALHLPASIRVVYGGLYEQQQKDFRNLAIVLVLAVILVFTVLLFEFGSFSAPIAILASALLSTAGVFVALAMTKTTVNVASYM